MENPQSQQPAQEEPQTIKRSKKKKTKFILKSGNFVSQLFCFWIFKLVYVCFKKPEIKNIMILLCPSETADVAGKKLQDEWNNMKEYFFVK
jgi:hypothetical protein